MALMGPFSMQMSFAREGLSVVWMEGLDRLVVDHPLRAIRAEWKDISIGSVAGDVLVRKRKNCRLSKDESRAVVCSQIRGLRFLQRITAEGRDVLFLEACGSTVSEAMFVFNGRLAQALQAGVAGPWVR